MKYATNFSIFLQIKRCARSQRRHKNILSTQKQIILQVCPSLLILSGKKKKIHKNKPLVVYIKKWRTAMMGRPMHHQICSIALPTCLCKTFIWSMVNRVVPWSEEWHETHNPRIIKFRLETAELIACQSLLLVAPVTWIGDAKTPLYSC